MVTIIDYGVGNIQAIINIYDCLNIETRVAASSEDLLGAKKIILPGVGSFDWVMENLNKSGMKESLCDLVLNKQVPILGICVGMQIMANSSEEGTIPGLGWIDAKVKNFNSHDSIDGICLPHMGWNDVSPVSSNLLFLNISNPRFYFLHSYYFSPAQSEQTLAITNYGCSFTSAVKYNNIFGVQFHPEKSHKWGIQLLNNFALI